MLSHFTDTDVITDMSCDIGDCFIVETHGTVGSAHGSGMYRNIAAEAGDMYQNQTEEILDDQSIAIASASFFFQNHQEVIIEDIGTVTDCMFRQQTFQIIYKGITVIQTADGKVDEHDMHRITAFFDFQNLLRQQEDQCAFRNLLSAIHGIHVGIAFDDIVQAEQMTERLIVDVVGRGDNLTGFQHTQTKTADITAGQIVLNCVSV